MIGRSHARWLAPLVAALALAGSAAAQHDEKILSKDDLEFARALQLAGYTDMADRLLEAFKKVKGGSGEVALETEIFTLKRQEEDARKLLDPVQRATALGQVVEATEKFVRDHAGTEQATDLQDDLPGLYQSVGEIIASALAKDPNSPEAKDLRARGTAMFERALDALRAQVETLTAAREKHKELKPDEPDTKLEYDYMVALYSQARTYYFSALVMDPTSLARKDPLQKALAILGDFELSFGDQLTCFEGYIYAGLCDIELGDLDRAVQDFDYAIRLRESYGADARGVYEMDVYAANIVSSAVLQKMLLLINKKNDVPGAIAVAEDFLKTTPEPTKTMRGLAVLVQLAEAYKTLGDDKNVELVAKRLIDADPHGLAGARGRELLGSGGSGSLGASDTLKLANETWGRGDLPRAVELAQEAGVLARGTAQEADLGTQAAKLLGEILSDTRWPSPFYYEATAVWDSAANRYPAGANAPECLHKAIQGYLQLLKLEQRNYFKTQARARMTELTKRYPKSSYAAKAAMNEGALLEAEGDYVRAAEMYASIPEGNPDHEEAACRSGMAWASHSRKLAQDGNAAGAAEASKKAEAIFKATRTEAESTARETLDSDKKNRMVGVSFQARVGLANLYLADKTRAGEVLQLFEGADREFSAKEDAKKLAASRDFRMRALMTLGQVDKAIELLDSLIKENPESDAVGPSAATLALALDARGRELRTAGKGSEGDAQWRKAANYYFLAIRAQIEGREAVNVESLEPIASRLLVFALHFNRVPEDVDTFLDWTGKVLDEDPFDRAIRALEAVVAATPSYRAEIALARAYGFVGRWDDAAARYDDLFGNEKLIDIATLTLRQEVLRAKPELLFASLEWGVAERESALARNDTNRLTRANQIFGVLVNQTKGNKLWWQAKYFQLRTLYDQGAYDLADVALKQIERENPDLDEGKFGMRERFVKLREDLSRKVFTK